MGDLDIHCRLELHAEVASQDHGRKAGKDDDDAELPTLNQSKDGAGHDAKGGDGDEGNVETHQLKDGVRVRCHALSKGTGGVLRAVKELQILPDDIVDHVFTTLATECLIHFRQFYTSQVRGELASKPTVLIELAVYPMMKYTIKQPIAITRFMRAKKFPFSSISDPVYWKTLTSRDINMAWPGKVPAGMLLASIWFA